MKPALSDKHSETDKSRQSLQYTQNTSSCAL